jgi:hypothetical protein
MTVVVAGQRMPVPPREHNIMGPEECRQLALLYREVAEEKSGDERCRLLLIAANLEQMAEDEDQEDDRDFRILH